MKKSVFFYAVIAMVFTGGVYAAEDATTPDSASSSAVSSSSAENTVAHRLPKDMSLEEMRQHAHERADKLDHMSEAQWEKIRQRAAQHGGAAANMTLEQAQQNTHVFAKRLDEMTPQQWEDFKNRMEARSKAEKNPAGSVPANGN